MGNGPGKLFVAGLIAIVPGIGQCAERVPVCVKPGDNIPTIVLVKAEALTSHMLATAGATVEWHSSGRSGCPGLEQARTVHLDLVITMPPGLHTGALAYAEPHRGPTGKQSGIVVIFDRVEHSTKRSSQVPNVLAHVITHEITHILQGTARHSLTGVMKARWAPSDFDLMEYHPLPFAPEDIELIRHGLTRRAGKCNRKREI
jgi:hypothetical protein